MKREIAVFSFTIDGARDKANETIEEIKSKLKKFFIDNCVFSEKELSK